MLHHYTVDRLVLEGWSPEEAPKFAAWMAELDRKVTKLCTMGIQDLPDWRFAECFEDGDTVESAFNQYTADMHLNVFED